MFGHFTTLCMKGLRWKMVNGLDLFTKIVNNWKSLTILVRISILDAWQGSEYVPEGLQKQEPVYSHVQFAKMNYNDKIKIRILTHFVLWDFYPWTNCIWKLTYTLLPIIFDAIHPLQANVPFLYLLKTSGDLWFSVVLRGYRMEHCLIWINGHCLFFLSTKYRISRSKVFCKKNCS